MCLTHLVVFPEAFSVADDKKFSVSVAKKKKKITSKTCNVGYNITVVYQIK